jgi:hypothetical protein
MGDPIVSRIGSVLSDSDLRTSYPFDLFDYSAEDAALAVLANA